MIFQFTPYVLLLIVGIVISIGLIYLIDRRHPERGETIFKLLMTGIIVWMLASIGELSSATRGGRIFFSVLAYAGILTIPTMYLVLVLDFTGRTQYLTRQNLLLALIMPLLTTTAILTNPLHNQYWTSIELITAPSGYIYGDFDRGILFYPNWLYATILLVSGSVLLIRSFLQSPEMYRGQVRLMLLGAAAPYFANFIYVFGILPAYFDITPLAFVVTGICTAWALLRLRLFDIIPVARTLIVEQMEDAVLVLDGRQRVVDANPAATRLFGKQGNAILGDSVHRLFESVDTENELEYLLHSTKRVEREIQHQRQTYRMSVSPMVRDDGTLSGQIVVLHDITQLKQTNEQLQIARTQAEETSRLKSEFLATMSHELRTPLNAVIGYAELQLSGMVGELTDKQYTYNERIHANGKHLLSLINDILDISKIEAGHMMLIKDRFSLAQWVQMIRSQNEVLAENKGLDFEMQIDPTLPDAIYGDQARLSQVAINLIGNAIKFTEDGSVCVTFERADATTWCIRVKDTGIGIAPHHIETIFQDFKQVDSGLNRKYSGTGLGLPIVQKLTTMMGGTIRVESELDKGSEFIVTLPIEFPAA